MTEQLNPYEVLGVPSDAPDEQIDEAYDRLYDDYAERARTGEEAAIEAMKRLNHAYDLLLDPDQRRGLDQQLKHGAAPVAEAESEPGLEEPPKSEPLAVAPAEPTPPAELAAPATAPQVEAEPARLAPTLEPVPAPTPTAGEHPATLPPTPKRRLTPRVLRIFAWVYVVASVLAGLALILVATSPGLAGMLFAGYSVVLGPIVILQGGAVWTALMVVANIADDLAAIRDALSRR